MHSNGDNQVDGNWEQRYLHADQIDYSTANKLVVEDLLLNNNDLKHCNRSMRYILSNILSTYFPQALNKQKVRYQDSYYLLKYIKWQAPLREVQYHIEKADIIPLPNLPLDKALIARCIDSFKKYLKRLEIKDVAIFNKLLILKDDFLTVHNVTRAIDRRQEELCPIERF